MDATATTSKRRLKFENDQDILNSSIGDAIKDSIHNKIPKAMVPRVGMEFKTEQEAYDFYNAYAFEAGFSVRRSKVHWHNGKLLDRNFVCSCEGTRGRDKRDDVYKAHRPKTRFGCLAMLKISCRQACSYRVIKFSSEHNHNLATPSKAHLFRSHRSISNPQASEVDMADISGIAPKNAFEFMANQAGGRENLGFAHVDYKNYLRTKRSLQMKSGDTGGVLEYLQKMQTEDPSFFYAIQVDEDDLITNIFWADGKMMADYDDFGDVVCFDTTYRKHKDGRPIALFVGVNHHKQTIIFGAALLFDETKDSFIWLFDTFARAMGGKPPKTMLTDQDIAMSSALASQWPETRHRLCIWHIFQNAATHLSNVFSKFKDFAADFSKCVYDYEHEEDFLDAWSRMLQKYELENNQWLKRLFNIKEKWAMVYGRDAFCGDMMSTQRSESMNRVIKQYVSYKHDLRRFFENFQRLLNDRRYGELVADFKADQSKEALFFPIEILKHAASVYTQAVFVLFQAELCKAYDCHVEHLRVVGECTEYAVTPNKKHYSYVVSYDGREEVTISCTCKKFEFAGLLCSHILKIFSIREIAKVPEKYILKRWTKDAKKGSRVYKESSAEIDPNAMIGRRYRKMCRISTRLLTRAATSEEASNIVIDGLMNLLKEVDLSSIENPSQTIIGSSQVTERIPTDVHMLNQPTSVSMTMSMNANAMMKEVKGIKPKPRSQSSIRPKSALEKARRNKRPKTKNTPGNDSQATIHVASPVHLEQYSSFRTPTLQQDKFQMNNMNALNQQGPLLPLLQHPQCDDIHAYAQLLQSSDI